MRWVDFKDSVKRFWSEYKHQKSGMLGLISLIILVILALAAPVITSPNIPKEWQPGGTEWLVNPKNAPPAWESHFIGESKAPTARFDPGQYKVSETTENGYNVYTITLHYRMETNIPPVDIVLADLKSNATVPTENPVVRVEIVRPPEKNLNNTLLLLDGFQFPSGSQIQIAGLQDTLNYLLYWLYENGVLNVTALGMEVSPSNIQFLTMSDPQISSLIAKLVAERRMQVIFGKIMDSSGNPRSFEDVVDNPEPLKGDYEIKITITAPSDVNVDFSDFKVVVVGGTYGLLGTDQYGRPIAIGLLWGTRVALSIGLAVAIASVLIGVLIGVVSAYLGGWADEAIQRFTEFMMTLPLLPMLILLSLYLGGRLNLTQLVIILVLFGWMGTTKVARSMALQIKEQTYIEAARALGASTGRVIFRHIVPQLLPYAFASIALSVPGAILSEAGLSFLGLTSQNMITWGQMLNAAYNNNATINGYWWQIIPPGLAIAFVGLVFVLIGVSLDTVLNPKLKRS
ncbi:ABC transporter permease [Thermococcus waiotapuensis]|uniref:ABC transporter permease n=1 Tax=Thermococcus waiotapuensis TaxID=90909 RepID=A0AAE4NV55_9EURY|nr:ABC transporter permease [Thermococcus waiotapuensis]MDV3104140.1 ABC transporter permease [Thermococcus waiotapuensis]